VIARPRIHWVSPLPPARTDIAEYTRRVLPDMAARAEVVLWTDAESWDPSLERHAIVRRFDPHAAVPLDMRGLPPLGGGCEAIFLHMGNSWEFHSGIFALTRRIPGIVVLHDLAIQEALRDMVFNDLLPRDVCLRDAERWYGKSGLRVAKRLLAGAPVRPEDLDEVPMFEAALSRATAVLAHTPLAAKRAAARRAFPVYKLDLPFTITEARAAERAATGPLRLVQFGHIGPNRRLLEIIKALGDVAPKVDFRFDVFGRIWDPQRVETAARAAGIADRVHLRGFAPEPELDATIAEAHLVFNLRNPTMGEASGSQLRIWNTSALAVVTDLGWYGSLPDDTVVKIPAEDEHAALVRLLERIDSDRSLCARVGARGRERLVQAHGTADYAEGIVRIARQAPADAAGRLVTDALRRLVSRSPQPGLIAERATRFGA